ncbi:unnamed protein product [Ilex paraguariensis]|uniref:Photolyase/cryptochrome alpha/beta domain-containing protein n=1 Tax=Ilex paraguariensis TaxID=185542 RepID=A0ABC8U262_9AQUA
MLAPFWLIWVTLFRAWVFVSIGIDVKGNRVRAWVMPGLDDTLLGGLGDALEKQCGRCQGLLGRCVVWAAPRVAIGASSRLGDVSGGLGEPQVAWGVSDSRIAWVAPWVVWAAPRGEAVDTIPNFLRECGASLLVTDFSPLREVQRWKVDICKRVGDSVSIHEVDAHNIVPIWMASEKLEYSARTIRGKINKQLPEFLIDFPTLGPPNRKWAAKNQLIDWPVLRADVLRKGAEVPEIEWCEPGEHAAMEVLIGNKNGFLMKRLKNYSTDRNNPLKPKGLSNLSPYLHFGQISAQRCALEARRVRKLCPQSVDAFLEELIVRRELADNFCFYQPHYDSLQGAWEWARKTLMDHASDKREHIYTLEQLEKAQAADPVSN